MKRAQVNKIINKKGEVTTDAIEMQRNISHRNMRLWWLCQLKGYFRGNGQILKNIQPPKIEPRRNLKI